ncbi:MAG: DUF1289 domain-containing protein [Alphaproteobacteria bacterium]|nr:DUF1289 domain-containing protein [Alphaproteobacteria bacterium]
MTNSSDPSDAVDINRRMISPCAGVCILHTETKLCLGCYRTIEEIAGWQEMSAPDQHRTMAEIAQRRTADGR